MLLKWRRKNDKMEDKEDHLYLKIQKLLKNWHFVRIVNEWLCGTLFKSRSKIGWWETKTKFTTPYIPVFPGSTSFLPPNCSEWCRRTGNGSSGQFIILCLCHSPLMMFPCFSMGPSHGMQSFRLLLCGLLSVDHSMDIMVLHGLQGSKSCHHDCHHRQRVGNLCSGQQWVRFGVRWKWFY